jgi:hypothetical protein
MISEENNSVLKILHDKLLDVDWRLIGSTNLALQGVGVKAEDIDIRIKVDDISKIQQALQPYCTKRIEYSKTDRFASYFGQFEINGVKIDVMAGAVSIERDIQVGDEVFSKNPIIVKIDDLSIPCVDLITEYNAYFAMGRRETAELIKIAINS